MPFAPIAAAVFLGGVLTILSPCVLPVLPIVFGSTGRPFARWTAPMLAGLVLAFVAVAITGTIGAAWVAEAADAGRWAALALVALFGASLLSARVGSALTIPLVRLGARIERRQGASARHGLSRGDPVRALLLGAATGLLWAPCAGPLLGLVVAIAVSGGRADRAAALFAVFGAGAATAFAVVLLAGDRVLRALRRVSGAEIWARRTVGALTLCAVAAIALGWDAALLSGGGIVQTANAEEAILARLAPSAKADAARALATPPRSEGGRPESSLSVVPTFDYGPLPDFVGGAGWLNGASLGLAADAGTLLSSALRGKVVVVNVWTFECYNCLNALPHIKALEAKYRGRGVVVIGVHTPELARERVPANVAHALERLGVTYPNVLDPDYRIWRAFHNEYWPSVYIADREGHIRFRHFGEGAYDEEDRVVGQLLTTPSAAPR